MLEFPEHAPIAAFDGDPTTSWAADRYLPASARWIEVGFARRRDVPWVNLQPIRDWRGIEREVDINGVRARLGPGVNRIPVRLEDVKALQVTLTEVDQPGGSLRGSGGFKEIEIPGFSPRRPLRPPVVTAEGAGRPGPAPRGAHLPVRAYDRGCAVRARPRDRQPVARARSNREDPERQIDRVIFAPEPRAYAVDAWVQPAIERPIRRSTASWGCAGRRHSTHPVASTAKPVTVPRARSTRGRDPWIGLWVPRSAPRPWVSWRSPRPLTVSRLRLSPPRGAVRRPPGPADIRRRLAAAPSRWGRTAPSWPRPARARRFRLTVLDARFLRAWAPPGAATRAVGIGTLSVPVCHRSPCPRRERYARPVAASRYRSADATWRCDPAAIAELDAGRPLRARGGGETRMGEGSSTSARVGVTSASTCCGCARRRRSRRGRRRAAAGCSTRAAWGRLARRRARRARRPLVARPRAGLLGGLGGRDGRSLGEPRPVDGYANGWRAPGDCLRVSFSFAPQGSANVGYAISAGVCLLLLGFLVAGRLAGYQRADAAPPPLLPQDGTPRITLPRAAAAALIATIPLCLLFALRSAVLIFPVLTLILARRGPASADRGGRRASRGRRPAGLRGDLAQRSRRLQLRVQHRPDLGALGRSGGADPADGRLLAAARGRAQDAQAVGALARAACPRTLRPRRMAAGSRPRAPLARASLSASRGSAG